MDILLTEPYSFVERYRNNHREPRRSSAENHRQYEVVCSSSTTGTALGYHCNKEVCAIWKPRLFQFRSGWWQSACSLQK